MSGALDAALRYAARGWRVHPLFGLTAGGACECHRGAACESRGKHPRLKGWPMLATTEEATIRAWWRQWPTANVGIATGFSSGIFVLDVDPRHGGDEALAFLESRHGPLPRTVRQLTGGGGEHVVFAHPGWRIGNQQGAATLAPGLDVRGDGGQIVVAPSFAHPGGRPYAWDAGHHPDDVPVASAPPWLLELVRGAAGSGNGRGMAAEVPLLIEDGTRNATLASLAGSMRRRGMAAEEILAGLTVVNERRCRPPLGDAELRQIAASVGRYAPGEAADSRSAGRASVWAAAQPAPEFLQTQEVELDFLEDRQLARGSITEWFSPRGLGKTLIAHALAVKHAQAGRRVLLIDRDNSRREVKRRLRAWGANETPALKVMTRDAAPALTDKAAWAAFPFASYDLVMIDSIDAATEGVGEQDSAKPAAALAPILDIAHREAGPAILLLGNVVKSGAYGRGSGVVEDRADIVYEVRDATQFTPSGTKSWWLELPPAGREAWGERAARRTRRARYRLAFIPSKFRIGEEPDPFVFEVDLTADPWTLQDVTPDVEASGRAAQAATAAARQATREQAVAVVLQELARRIAAGLPDLGKRAAETLLTEAGVTRAVARTLLREERRWQLVPDPDDARTSRVVPAADRCGQTHHPPSTVVDPAVSAVSRTQPLAGTPNGPNAAARSGRARPHLPPTIPASGAGILNLPGCGRAGNIPPASDLGRIVNEPEGSAPVDVPARLLEVPAKSFLRQSMPTEGGAPPTWEDVEG